MSYRIFKGRMLFIGMLLTFTFSGHFLLAQKEFHEIQYKHVSFELPGVWSIKKKQDKGGDYSIVCKRDTMQRFAVYCVNDEVNLKNLLFKHTGLLKAGENMAYMSIDEEENVKFNHREAITIGVHNQYLTDFYKGAFFAFHEQGRTFVVFWFTKETQQNVEALRKTLESLKIKR